MNRNVTMRSETRAGLMKMELMVSCLLLTALMGLVGGFVYRVNVVWKQGQHYQFAVGELRNEMARLTVMPREELEKELDAINLSEICKQQLDDANMKGKLSEDKLGTRLTLELNWRRGANPVPPIRLEGWLE